MFLNAQKYRKMLVEMRYGIVRTRELWRVGRSDMLPRTVIRTNLADSMLSYKTEFPLPDQGLLSLLSAPDDITRTIVGFLYG